MRQKRAKSGGQKLRYWVESQEGVVALLSFSAAAWSTEPVYRAGVRNFPGNVRVAGMSDIDDYGN